MKALTCATAAFVSGFLANASLPPGEQPILAWLALVPLLLVLRRTTFWQACILGFLMGSVLCGLNVRWLLVIPQLQLSAYFTIIAYSALYYGLFAGLLAYTRQRTRLPGMLLAPVFWTALEFLRANLSFLATPFVLLGQSQYTQLEIIQLAAIGSVWAVSFLVVLVNAAIVDTLNTLLDPSHPNPPSLDSRLGKSAALPNQQLQILRLALLNPTYQKIKATQPLFIAMSVLVVAYFWGDQQIHHVDTAGDEPLKIALIQANIPQYDHFDREQAKFILNRYRELSVAAAAVKPDLLVWPEGATPGYINTSPTTHRFVNDLVRQLDIPLLLGSSAQEKTQRDGKKSLALKNSALLIDPTGQALFFYDKIMLVPFAEYMPLRGQFSWPGWLVNSQGRQFMPGTDYTLFEFKQQRFGVVICWEVFFPNLFRQFVHNGAQFMLNLADEAWFSHSEASRHLLSLTVFRAVENRVALLRATNTGISAVIDATGRIRERIIDQQGQDLMVAGWLATLVPKPSIPSFYTDHGEMFALTVIIIAILMMLFAVFRQPANTFLPFYKADHP